MKGKFEFGLPIIEISVENKKLNVLLDTGFNGEIMLPKRIIDELDLELIGLTDYITVGGNSQVTHVYKGKIKIFDEERETTILSTPASFSLAGMELFHLCRITLERHTDKIEIEKTS